MFCSYLCIYSSKFRSKSVFNKCWIWLKLNFSIFFRFNISFLIYSFDVFFFNVAYKNFTTIITSINLFTQTFFLRKKFLNLILMLKWISLNSSTVKLWNSFRKNSHKLVFFKSFFFHISIDAFMMKITSLINCRKNSSNSLVPFISSKNCDLTALFNCDRVVIFAQLLRIIQCWTSAVTNNFDLWYHWSILIPHLFTCLQCF